MLQPLSHWESFLASPAGAQALAPLYPDGDAAARYAAAITAFSRLFGDRPAALLSAPGRTELAGNHTDHQHGHVLAAAVRLDMLCVAAPNGTENVRVHSEGYGRITISLDELTPKPAEKNSAAALLRGIAAGFLANGLSVGGFDAFVCSDVPKGSGLSSSAAFEVLIGTVCNRLFNDGLVAPTLLARIGQYAENRFFGKPCGLMDQMASASGGVVGIDFLDPARPIVTAIPVRFEAWEHNLYIVNAGGSHAGLTAEYGAIPAEMGMVAARFGKSVLRDVPEQTFYDALPRLRGEVPDRALLRAIHFYGEERRALGQMDALRRGDETAYRALMQQSGDSSENNLQNIYPANGSPERSVALALTLAKQALAGRGACRVHGGGFAGTIQCLVPKAAAADFERRMEQAFGRGCCHALHVRPVGGYALTLQ